MGEGYNGRCIDTTYRARDDQVTDRWKAHRERPDVSTVKLQFHSKGNCLSYGEFLEALLEEHDFRQLLQEELRAAPFVAYRWETPPLTSHTLDHPFSCLLHNSPDLDVTADDTDFRYRFKPGEAVVCFENLGADALLIVPCPVSASANYSHIGAFHRSAPSGQQHALWELVARSAMTRAGTQPLWLSTAGGGVDWLHVRLDSRPKYYRYTPWKLGR